MICAKAGFSFRALALALSLVAVIYIGTIAHFVEASALERSTADRTDDNPGPQIHVIYVLPKDGRDRNFDVDGSIVNSVASFQKWLSEQTIRRTMRMDTYQGLLDVTFFQLSRTDAQVAEAGAYVRDVIEADLKEAGMTAPNKIYAVYYDGHSTYACGGGAWPPELPGIVAGLYLLGEPPGWRPCWTNPLAAPGAPPGYWEFSMLHEILHTLGFVAVCAPHHTLRGHVSDSSQDLMYAGNDPWHPSTLDVGHDDYYMHNISGCPDLAESNFLGAPGETTFIPEFTSPSIVALSAFAVSIGFTYLLRRRDSRQFLIRVSDMKVRLIS